MHANRNRKLISYRKITQAKADISVLTGFVEENKAI
jgi:hypothetical protein